MMGAAAEEDNLTLNCLCRRFVSDIALSLPRYHTNLLQFRNTCQSTVTSAVSFHVLNESIKDSLRQIADLSPVRSTQPNYFAIVRGIGCVLSL